IEVCVPAEATAPAIDDPGVERELHPRILHAADVGREEVREIASGGDRYGENEIARALVVPVDGAADSLIMDAPVEAHVVGLCLFPLDVRIDRGRTDGAHERIAELHL